VPEAISKAMRPDTTPDDASTAAKQCTTLLDACLQSDAISERIKADLQELKSAVAYCADRKKVRR
jgi:heterodisulfide reductase subunit B